MNNEGLGIFYLFIRHRLYGIRFNRNSCNMMSLVPRTIAGCRMGMGMDGMGIGGCDPQFLGTHRVQEFLLIQGVISCVICASTHTISFSE